MITQTESNDHASKILSHFINRLKRQGLPAIKDFILCFSSCVKWKCGRPIVCAFPYIFVIMTFGDCILLIMTFDDFVHIEKNSHPFFNGASQIYFFFLLHFLLFYYQSIII